MPRFNRWLTYICYIGAACGIATFTFYGNAVTFDGILFVTGATFLTWFAIFGVFRAVAGRATSQHIYIAHADLADYGILPPSRARHRESCGPNLDNEPFFAAAIAPSEAFAEEGIQVDPVSGRLIRGYFFPAKSNEEPVNVPLTPQEQKAIEQHSGASAAMTAYKNFSLPKKTKVAYKIRDLLIHQSDMTKHCPGIQDLLDSLHIAIQHLGKTKTEWLEVSLRNLEGTISFGFPSTPDFRIFPVKLTKPVQCFMRMKQTWNSWVSSPLWEIAICDGADMVHRLLLPARIARVSDTNVTEVGEGQIVPREARAIELDRAAS